MRRKEIIWMQNNEKMEICTQGYPHGVCYRGSHQKNDVSRVSIVERLGHTHVMKMVFSMQGMAFAILYFCASVGKGHCLVFHSSHVSLYFLPRFEKFSLEILGLRVIINSDFFIFPRHPSLVPT